jgi:hypothetical protein
MFSITVDVIREVMEISLRGNPTETQIADMTEQLESALSTLPLSRAGAYRVRIKSRPNNPKLTQLAASICGVADHRMAVTPV